MVGFKSRPGWKSLKVWLWIWMSMWSLDGQCSRRSVRRRQETDRHYGHKAFLIVHPTSLPKMRENWRTECQEWVGLYRVNQLTSLVQSASVPWGLPCLQKHRLTLRYFWSVWPETIEIMQNGGSSSHSAVEWPCFPSARLLFHEGRKKVLSLHDTSSSSDAEQWGREDGGGREAGLVRLTTVWQKVFALLATRTQDAAELLSLHQSADHRSGIQAAQVVVGLPRAHEHDGLTRDVRHGDCSTHLWRKRAVSFRNYWLFIIHWFFLGGGVGGASQPPLESHPSCPLTPAVPSPLLFPPI